MEVLGRIIFEYLFGYVLQGFVYVLGIYAFNRRRIERSQVSKYILVSLFFAVVSFLVRLLPIYFGVHTVLDLILLFLVSITVLKMPIYVTVRSTLFVTVLLLVTEALCVGLMTLLLGQEVFEQKMLDPLEKAILALPGVFLFAASIITFYFVLNRTKKAKSDSDGKTGSKISE